MVDRPVLTGIALFLCTALLSTACTQSEKRQTGKAEPIGSYTLTVARSPLSLPVYVARNKGYFTEQGLEVELLEQLSGLKCLEAVFSGKADMATVADVPVVLESFDRHDFVVVATLAYMRHSVRIAARREAGINSPTDLAGKRIGIVPGTSSQFSLDLFLKRNGLDADMVEVRYLAPNNMLQALKEKTVDAVSIWDPYFFEIVKQLGPELVVLEQKTDSHRSFNLAVMRDYSGKDRRLIEGILLALDRAKHFIREHEAEAREIMASEFGGDKEFSRNVWGYFEISLSLDQELLLILEELARSSLNQEYVGKQAMPNYLEFIDTAPLLHILPENVTIIGPAR